MNIQTFRDAVSSKRSTLIDDDHDDYDDDEREAAPLKKNIEGEEEDGAEKVFIGRIVKIIFLNNIFSLMKWEFLLSRLI